MTAESNRIVAKTLLDTFVSLLAEHFGFSDTYNNDIKKVMFCANTA